jgi:hypothetical protein
VALTKAATSTATVSLTSSATALGVPASVTINAGSSSRTFTATAGTVSSDQAVTVTASWNGQSRQATVNLSAPNAPPVPVSVTPSSGTGSSQTFTLTYSDAAGHADIQSVRAIFHQQIQAENSCYLYYTKADNKLSLYDNSGTVLLGGITPGVSGTTSNGQCTLNGGASSAVNSGNTLTLSVAITFQASFTGTKAIYGYATDQAGANSGWQTLGTWTVPSSGANVAPVALSVSPTSGFGSRWTFTFTYTDANGSEDLASARALIHSQLSETNACSVFYSKADNRLYLRNNAGTAFLAGITPGVAGTSANTQCTVDGGASSVLSFGNSLTLNLAIIFKPSFAGSKNVYGYATDQAAATSGWQPLGTWYVF